MEQTVYSQDEILAEHGFAKKLSHDGRKIHGGLDAEGRYLPPRSLNRIDAIRIWSKQVSEAGNELDVMDRKAVIERFEFFPTVEQAKFLLENGCKDAMTRLLTMIGIVEGFGNDGIKLMPDLDMASYFVESVDGTCLDHLHRGLLRAHGLDEAGSEHESGHDEMWFAIRDVALDRPDVTDDMFENLPIAPPPGYTGRAKPAAEALSVGDTVERLFAGLDPALEMTLRGLAQILLVELGAYKTFAWAREVLADPKASAAPEWAPRMVDCIQADEDIHVNYLECALAEARARTFLAVDGERIPGPVVIDRICEAALERQSGARMQRMMAHRYRNIVNELEERADGKQILEKFQALGPVPALQP